MRQTKYASAVPKNLGLGLNFRPCSEDYFLYWRPLSVKKTNERTLTLLIHECIFF